MITTTAGRFFAVIALMAAGAFLVALGIVSGVSNRITVHDVIAGGVAAAVAVVAALWLYRDRRQHGRQP
jgi:hypothetical protein